MLHPSEVTGQQTGRLPQAGAAGAWERSGEGDKSPGPEEDGGGSTEQS